METYINKQEVLNWLTKEIEEATGIAGQFLNRSIEEDYDDLEHEIERHEQDGWVRAMEYVKNIMERQHG